MDARRFLTNLETVLGIAGISIGIKSSDTVIQCVGVIIGVFLFLDGIDRKIKEGLI